MILDFGKKGKPEVVLKPHDEYKEGWFKVLSATTITLFDTRYSVHPVYLKIPAELHMVTDEATIPKGFRWLFPKHTSHGTKRGYETAGVYHDYLYTFRMLQSSQGQMYSITRKDADLIMKLIMEKLGVKRFRRVLIYRALRLFGWVWWNYKTKQELIY